MKARHEKEKNPRHASGLPCQSRSARRGIALALAVLLLLAGIGVILYPHAEQYLYARQIRNDFGVFTAERRQEQSAAARPETIQDPSDRSESSSQAEAGPAGYIDEFPELYERMLAYNEQLAESGQSALTDLGAYEQASFDLSEYGFDENIIGYIEIPKIDVLLPIYLGANTENLKKGAAHLSQTSLPIGGVDTGCVICAHRNYSKAAQFTRLVELEAGDEVIITNLWQTMIYRVTGTDTILDSDAQSLKIQDGKDMLSLFTCYYNGDRKDRFVAFCERAD